MLKVANNRFKVEMLLRGLKWEANEKMDVLREANRKVRALFSRMAAAAKYFHEHPEVLHGYLLYAHRLGFLNALRRAIKIVKRGMRRREPMPVAIRQKLRLGSGSGQPIAILTPTRYLYVARSISAALSRLGIIVTIIHEPPINGYSNEIHFVLCPQTFLQLPAFYIAFQMEQSINLRAFTSDYLRVLENSAAILDYSTVNINFLAHKGLNVRKIFYVPIGHNADYRSGQEPVLENFDVLFYGHTDAPRGRNFLNELKKHFHVNIIDNLFGEPLYALLARARIVVNIHSNPHALLETTRIWECLSLNKLVVSERSSDMDQHGELLQLVDFVDIDDIAGMTERVRYWLDNDDLRRERIFQNTILLQQQPNQFDYFFYRFLLATDNITFEDFWYQAGQRTVLPSDTIFLTLPEYSERTADFSKDNHLGFSGFPGLRHTESWIGCAMSYKLLMMLARQQRLKKIVICEDDVDFPANFDKRWQDIQCHLDDPSLRWDIFSGLMSDLDKNVHILEAHLYQGHQFVTTDKLMGMVFNVYSQHAFDIIAQWNPSNHDVTTNTIDRYLENYRAMKILTIYPFLVGHKDSQQSTIWGVENSYYNDLILTSSELLKEKIRAYYAQ